LFKRELLIRLSYVCLTNEPRNFFATFMVYEMLFETVPQEEMDLDLGGK